MNLSALQLLQPDLLPDFKAALDFDIPKSLESAFNSPIPADYFQFYKSVSSVYSSKIEGEQVEFDSYFKHKVLHVELLNTFTQRADDLFEAYEFITTNELNLQNVNTAHKLITRNLLPAKYRGAVRTNPMFVINENDQIDYVACDAAQLSSELSKFFHDVALLSKASLAVEEVFYFAALLHLVFVKIHPYQDGNGRTARLLEKWFLIQHLGAKAIGIQLEKNYYLNLQAYYKNIKALGVEYIELNYTKALPFLLMTIKSVKQ